MLFPDCLLDHEIVGLVQQVRERVILSPAVMVVLEDAEIAI